jgi:hypothetical protein
VEAGGAAQASEPLTATQAISFRAFTQNHASASFTSVVGGGGVAPLSYSVSPTLPTGLSIYPTSGVVSGTPSATSPNTTCTVTVTDGDNATATNTFSLTVNGPVTATQSICLTTLTQERCGLVHPRDGRRRNGPPRLLSLAWAP